MKTLEQFTLSGRLRRSRLPKNRDLAMQVGLEFMRAAVDGRQPAAWARAALQPRRRRR